MASFDLDSVKKTIASESREQLNYFAGLPRKNYVYAFVSLLGIATTIMPWAKSELGFFIVTLTSGMQFFFGWLVFLIYLAFFVLMLFNKYLKVNQEIIKLLPKYASAAASALSLLFIAWRLFLVSYGAYLCLGISLILFVYTWFLAKKNPTEKN